LRRLPRKSGRLLALATERICSPRTSRKRTKRAISAKALIDQKHVDIVHAALEPPAVKRRWAESHGSIFSENPALGTLRLDGKMTDKPQLRAAKTPGHC
jgi:citrate lyase subunit beta/citryl-CoA lyase